MKSSAWTVPLRTIAAPKAARGAAVTSMLLAICGCAQEPSATPAPVASVASASHSAPPATATKPSPRVPPGTQAPQSSARVPEKTRGDAACPSDMVLVDGNACPTVQHECVEWLDDPKLPYARCAVYSPNATCVGKRKPMRYCIDRDELVLPGERLPAADLNFVKASKLCRERGRRMCLESEWTFACEGEEMRPYPYGWERKPVCNQDRANLTGSASREAALVDQRVAAEAFPECLSPFGVHDMVGNVDELVQRDKVFDPRFRNLLKGGWWMPARNRCRPATADHDDYFHELQIGTRCCADAAELPPKEQTQN